MLQPPFENIEDLHEYMFQILLKLHEEDNSFMFTLRQPHHFINTKKKHWFYGGTTDLYFSCWENVNEKDTTPDLYFSIDLTGVVSLTSLKRANFIRYSEKIFSKIKPMEENIIDAPNAIGIDLFPLSEIEKLKYIIAIIEEVLWHKHLDSREFNRRLKYILEKRELINITDIKQLKLSHMALCHLFLKNAGHFSTLNIEFHQRITCIFGGNGSGKSTILRAIGSILLGEDVLLEKNQKKVENFLRIKGQTEGFAEYEENGEISLSYLESTDNEQVNENQLFFSFENGEISIEKKGDFAHINQKANFPLLIIGFPQKQSNEANTDADKNPSKAGVKDLRKLVYDEPDNRFAAFEKWILRLHNATNEARLSGKDEPQELQIIHKTFEIISAVTGMPVSFQMASAYLEKVWICTDDAPNGIPLSMVSQGYANVFGWVGYFMKRLAEVNPNAADFTQCPAIVIIDEIDTYLHPNWQENILRVMAEKFPKVQFIVSTHSLFVYTSIPHDWISIYHLEKENDRIVCNKITDNLYGADRNEGADSIGASRRYKDALLKMEKLMNLIYTNQLLEAETFLNESFNDMNPRDEELLKAKTLLNAKKRLLKV